MNTFLQKSRAPHVFLTKVFKLRFDECLAERTANRTIPGLHSSELPLTFVDIIFALETIRLYFRTFAFPFLQRDIRCDTWSLWLVGTIQQGRYSPRLEPEAVFLFTLAVVAEQDLRLEDCQFES